MLFLRLEIAFTNKTVGINAKSSKLLQDALSAVLLKHQLKREDVVVTIVSMFEVLLINYPECAVENDMLARKSKQL